ncbi:MAG: HAD hydrolase family protein [Akkermansiaceae bacterium]|nr:HAD hydrolase family protein [Akkermansiaceae bacterium]
MKLLAPFTEADAPRWLLSFDFDGTLVVAEEDPAVCADFFELMRSMRSDHRSCWGINTGRSLMQTVQGLVDARFPILPDYIIAREREIYLPNEFGRWVGNAQWNKQCEREHHKLFRQCRKVLKHLKQWVETETAAVWGIQKEEPAGIVASTAAEMDLIVDKIDDTIEAETALSYQRNGIYLRFSHKHYHKGTAMLEVARLMGLSSQHAFAVGDSHNDLDMLNPEMAEMLACPANACPEVKLQVESAGGYVAKGHASRGVVEALGAHFANKK